MPVCVPAHQTWNGEAVKYIGYYPTEVEAAQAYDKSLIKMALVKPGTVLNFPVETYDPSKLDEDPNIAKLAPVKGGKGARAAAHRQNLETERKVLN